jgi:hypothetical protein
VGRYRNRHVFCFAAVRRAPPWCALVCPSLAARLFLFAACSRRAEACSKVCGGFVLGEQQKAPTACIREEGPFSSLQKGRVWQCDPNYGAPAVGLVDGNVGTILRRTIQPHSSSMQRASQVNHSGGLQPHPSFHTTPGIITAGCTGQRDAGESQALLVSRCIPSNTSRHCLNHAWLVGRRE